MNVRLLLLFLCAVPAVACDPITSVQGRIVRSPVAGGGAPAPVTGATVNVKCKDLRPEEGITTTTDLNGTFSLSTVGGVLPDACTLDVTAKGAPTISTTIGAAKTQGDDPDNRVRKVEVTLGAQ